MLNNGQVQGYARALARRLLAADPAAIEAAVGRGYLVTLGRPADDVELADSLAFIEAATKRYQAAGKDDAAETAMADFCQVLFSLNEFIYID